MSSSALPPPYPVPLCEESSSERGRGRSQSGANGTAFADRMGGPACQRVDHISIRLDALLKHAPEGRFQCLLALRPLHEPAGIGVVRSTHARRCANQRGFRPPSRIGDSASAKRNPTAGSCASFTVGTRPQKRLMLAGEGRLPQGVWMVTPRCDAPSSFALTTRSPQVARRRLQPLEWTTA
jgi:hypothetical protein